MEELNVLYTTDKNYFKYMITSLYSLLEHNTDLKLNIHIVTDGFTRREFELIERVLILYDNAKVIYHPFFDIEDEIERSGIPKWRGTNMANARVFFSKAVKDVPNLLYLDSDTFVVGSLKGLANYDGTLNMVRDNMPEYLIKGLGVPVKMYCNSGVIYVNMDKWYKNDCDKKIVDTLKAKTVNLRYPDQDIINGALKDDISVLPPEYNLFSIDYYYRMPFLKLYDKNTNIMERYPDKELKHAKKHPIVLHGTPIAFLKDYTIEKRLHPYNKYYTYYNELIYGDSSKEKLNLLEKTTMDAGLHAKVLFPKGIRTTIRSWVRRD